MEQNMKIIDYFYTNPQVLSKISQAEVMDVVTLGTAILADDTSSYLIQKKAFGFYVRLLRFRDSHFKIVGLYISY